MIYNINEGYNLEDKDKTYFDKYNIRELLESLQVNKTLGTNFSTSNMIN